MPADGGASEAEQRAQVKRLLALGEEQHYAALELSEGCSSRAVKAAFRRLARLVHPDKCKVDGAHRAFLKLQAAHETLSDPDARKTYDQERQGLFGARRRSQRGYDDHQRAAQAQQRQRQQQQQQQWARQWQWQQAAQRGDGSRAGGYSYAYQRSTSASPSTGRART